MAKRSPILGYNHNVLYRGLVFHVQTEDSGQLSPHLFTHLFHGGVIISTRKLVYDAGAAEDAIKGLMQAQHKVVLKDLKKGTFDDKIDAYLVGTEGLLPRTSPATAPAAAAATAEVPAPPPEGAGASAPEITIQRPGTEEIDQLDAIEPIELIGDRPSEPVITIEPGPAIARTATPPPIPRAATPSSVPPTRTQTAERHSGATSVRTMVPPPPPSAEEIDPPTDPDVDSDAIHLAVNATVKTPMIEDGDSAPEISIKLDLEDDPSSEARTRTRQDTEVQSDGIPGAIGAMPSGPALPVTPERKTGERVPALGAAALPPARPISRPPSRQPLSSSAVMSRPIAEVDRSDAVEVYAPPPSSADPPPERSERPGQYAQHKKPSAKLPVDVIKGGERPGSGSFPIPSGLARPGRAAPGPVVTPPRPSSPSSQPVATPRTASSGPVAQPRAATPASQPTPTPVSRPPSAPHQVPRVHSPSQPPESPITARTTTPSRVSPAGSPNARASASGGVVMTRPAVIVGAPAKPASPPRVRKAREEEGRGFGQGLISEKSLDEVILAYLSEDAEDK